MPLLREQGDGPALRRSHKSTATAFLDLCKMLHLCLLCEYIGVCECILWLLISVPCAFLSVPEQMLRAAKTELVFVALRSLFIPQSGKKWGCVWTCAEDLFLLCPTPHQIRQRVHQILNMRGSSIKIVRHILKGE